MQGNEEKPAAGFSSGSKRSKKDGKGRKKGRGLRRRNPNLHRREVKVSIGDVPEGAERKGYQAHTVRDIVFFAEEVAWLREVWQFPDGSRHVAPLPPGVATGRRQHGPGVRAPVIMLYHQGRSTVERIVAFLNKLGLDICARQVGRFLNEDTDVIVEEQREVLRAGPPDGPPSALRQRRGPTGCRACAQNSRSSIAGRWMTGSEHETVAPHVAGRVPRQCDRGLWRGGHHAAPDLPDLRAANDVGADPENGIDLHGGQHRAVHRLAANVRGDPALKESLVLTCPSGQLGQTFGG